MKNLSRRDALKLIGLASVSIVLSACKKAPPGATATSEATAAPTQPSASKYTQSPMLDDLVRSGELPPVDQRLPEDIYVVGPGDYLTEEQLPDWQPGIYGGTLRTAHFIVGWASDMFVALNEPLLTAPKISVQGLRGNVVKDFKAENNNQDFTFTLRKGLKWSDGVPVTMEDVRFTWEDIYGNDKIQTYRQPNFNNGFTFDGETGKFTILDDYTFKISFTQPYGGFLRNMAIESWMGYTELINPSHYLKQYHIKYTPIEKMAEDLKALNLTNGEWWQVFTYKRCKNYDMTDTKSADYPGLYPWVLKASDNPSVLTWERNPYYFKVDTKGQQLPYVDKIISVLQENAEMVNLKVFIGDVDYLNQSASSLVKMPLYLQNEAKGGYNTVLLETHSDPSNIFMNETFDDKNWQTVVQDLRFRQALSLAMDRQEIVDNVYYGYAAISSETVDPAYAKQDIDKANALLDAMGLTKKDADGFRLYPDGSPMNILLENGQEAPDFTPIADLVAANAKKVGIRIQPKSIDPNLRGQKESANQLQMYIFWSHDRGVDNDVTDPAKVGMLYADWLQSGGKKGVEPPDWIKKAIDINTRRWKALSGSDEYNAIVAEGLKWTSENLPYINLVEHVKIPIIVDAKLSNVPPSGALAYDIAVGFSVVQMYFNK